LQTLQLSKIKLLYNLTEELNLEEQHVNIATGVNYPGYPDLVFAQPQCELILHSALPQKVAKYVSRSIDVPVRIVRDSIATRRLTAWGKMQLTETSEFGEPIGGDLISGHAFTSSAHTRDATHVKVCFFSVTSCLTLIVI
jgi:hypothetical protein